MSDWPMDSSYVCHRAGSVEEDDLQFSVCLRNGPLFFVKLLSEILLTSEEDTIRSEGELHPYVLYDSTKLTPKLASLTDNFKNIV